LQILAAICGKGLMMVRAAVLDGIVRRGNAPVEGY